MAMDPNFALRTHERLFTGRNRNTDAELRRAAWSSVPKCASCGGAVMFINNVPQHYDGRWDGDLKPMEQAEMKASTQKMDSEHPADAQIPVVKPVAPGQTADPNRVAKPGATSQERGGVTRSVNAKRKNRIRNANLGRQWNPGQFDESGMLKPFSDWGK